MKNKTVLYLMKGENEKELSALLKRRAIADYFGDAKLSASPSGKPIIMCPEGFYISVSHSGGVVGVAISSSDIGLDIEERKERNNERIKERFFHTSEQNEDFYDLWVKKEALAKLSGKGIFSEKGKKLDEDVVCKNLSEELSSYSGKSFSACIMSRVPLETDIKEL